MVYRTKSLNSSQICNVKFILVPLFHQFIKHRVLNYFNSICNLYEILEDSFCKYGILKVKRMSVPVHNKNRGGVIIPQTFSFIMIIIDSIKVADILFLLSNLFINMFEFVTTVTVFGVMENEFGFLGLVFENLQISFSCDFLRVVSFNLGHFGNLRFKSWLDFMFNNRFYPLIQRLWRNLFLSISPCILTFENLLLLLSGKSTVLRIHLQNLFEIVLL